METILRLRKQKLELMAQEINPPGATCRLFRPIEGAKVPSAVHSHTSEEPMRSAGFKNDGSVFTTSIGLHRQITVTSSDYSDDGFEFEESSDDDEEERFGICISKKKRQRTRRERCWRDSQHRIKYCLRAI